MGLPETGAMQASLQDSIEEAVDRELDQAKRSRMANDDEVENIVLRAVSKICRDKVGKKPVCKVLINRLVDG